MMLTRRDLLQTSLLASAVFLAASKGKRASAQKTARADAESKRFRSREDTGVLVIGAGAAGLSAARSLRTKGFQVIVLEGRNRIGGRVWTDRSLHNAPIDLGASWIHGVRGNPLTELARKFNVKTFPMNYGSVTLYDPQGRPLDPDQESEVFTRYWEVYQRLEQLRAEMEEEEEDDISVQEALDYILAERTLPPRQRRELDYAINVILEHEYAASCSKLSFYYWDGADVFGGGDALIPGGYDQIIKGIAEGTDIRLEHVVERIEYDKTGVAVTTSKGVFQAERAVITLPLGVLKSGDVAFDPPLPKRKQVAIRRLGMGVLDKVVLQFPRVFWPEDRHLIGRIAKSKGVWAEWQNLYKLTGQPLLLGFNAGDYGLHVEKLSDKQILREAMTVLRTLYGPSIPNPTAWRITRWKADPFAYGSYSHIPPGASDADYETLAEPVGNILFFAGEATSRAYPGTVHGAYLSGVRAAQSIAEN